MERSLAGIAGTTREPEISCISSLKRWLVCSLGIDDALPPTPLLDTDPLLNPNRSRSGGFKPTWLNTHHHSATEVMSSIFGAVAKT